MLDKLRVSKIGILLNYIFVYYISLAFSSSNSSPNFSPNFSPNIPFHHDFRHIQRRIVSGARQAR